MASCRRWTAANARCVPPCSDRWDQQAHAYAVFSGRPEGNRRGSPFDILAVTRDRASGLMPPRRAISVDWDKGYGAIVASCSHMQFGIR
jgi:hypothetical protein